MGLPDLSASSARPVSPADSSAAINSLKEMAPDFGPSPKETAPDFVPSLKETAPDFVPSLKETAPDFVEPTKHRVDEEFGDFGGFGSAPEVSSRRSPATLINRY